YPHDSRFLGEYLLLRGISGGHTSTAYIRYLAQISLGPTADRTVLRNFGRKLLDCRRNLSVSTALTSDAAPRSLAPTVRERQKLPASENCYPCSSEGQLACQCVRGGSPCGGAKPISMGVSFTNTTSLPRDRKFR